MVEAKRFYRKLCRQLSTVWLIALLGLGLGCAPKHVAQQSPPPPPAQVAGGDAGATRTVAPVENKISPQQAQELFRSVDEILAFASADTALPIKHEVKRRLTSRDEVTAFIEKHMEEDEDAQRLRRSELVLKKFGLLPRDFDLQHFLLALLREQVAGYYDPKSKTVNLLDWIDSEQQKPVMAHELTHALQDQSFGLEKWMKFGEGDLAERKGEPSAADIDNDEISSARQAVVEGQAMAVLVDYELAPAHQSLLDSPQTVEALKQGMLVGTADSPEFGNAPIYLKEALVFPYRYGLDFVVELLNHGGKGKAFAGAFTNPPRSTRQIMEPQTYLDGEKIEPMRLPDFAGIFKNYERFDVGAVGEFDVAVLIDQFAGAEASHNLYPEWRGGYYYAARPKGDSTAPLGLMYASRWSNAEKAADFAAIYAKSLAKRYQRAHQVIEGTRAELKLESLESLTGKHTWLTEEGPVVIEVQGDTVLVSESLDQDTTDKLGRSVFQPALATAPN
ncbi:MAG: hypothetical protein LAO03_08830 [Acidobacteriia bacterium]|nr:hypothetical protein [Terriglobia bacterium]